MSIELVLPTIEHKEAAMEFRQEHFDCGEMVIHGDGGLATITSYEDWLAKIQVDENRAYSEEFVPATVYFGIHDGTIVGIIQIRHRLNQRLLETYGHIGYGIRPSKRRKGFATQMLSLALEKCRELGIEKVLLSCDMDNIASAKTIIKNGGLRGNEFAEEDGTTVHQYWINL